ncbi:coiled-coil domain-containing protein 27-like isoform X2 [Narcine bancroftii]|uniref:coiled-coil domain-containing protein 27-like isoform X2 n=1 Tax=Narcine bancroftii TaxID=1343680 RepID=UPI00383128D7
MKGFLALQKRKCQGQKSTVEKCDLTQIKVVNKGIKKAEEASGKKVKNQTYNTSEKNRLDNAAMLSTATNVNRLSLLCEASPSCSGTIQLDWSDENLNRTSRHRIPWHFHVIHGEKSKALVEEKTRILSVTEVESEKKDVHIATLQDEVTSLTRKLRSSIEEDMLKMQSMHKMQNELESLKEVKDESNQKDLIIADLRDQIWQLGLQVRLLRDDVSIAALDTLMDEESSAQQQECKGTREACAEISSKSDSQEKCVEGEERTLSMEGDEVEGKRSLMLILSEAIKSSSISLKSVDQKDNESLSTEEENVGPLVMRNKELEKKVKEMEENYNMSTGTVKSLNRKLSLMEAELRKSETTLIKLRKELRERCSQLQDMSSKFSSLREEGNQIQMVKVLQNENVQLKELVAKLQAEVRESRELTSRLSEERDSLHLHLREEEERQKQLQDVCDRSKAENSILQCQLQEQQVALQATGARLERFISRMVQAIYSTPGIEQPTTQITDEDTFAAFKKILDERLEFYGMLNAHEVAVHPLFSSNTGDPQVAP